ncbi:MAG: hypothetical protein U0934_04300 [Pseudotabrizicola sp.]|uniref:hypothetical protein n=1 Tax=Pseudotabrizicola sp. TaxID=2939647 RepID=UPI0027238607|nr:hypothetical protein [Pseudotabrizicola sp.]MDO8884210.1 hypothetical protein [Pseudotabrizicola sp.]MDP2079895.1 hypothetical protein [Pseudotabrizicola sp.]MDZ7573160.1 hypothetical protein [Pseudotabrizicola sp.]
MRPVIKFAAAAAIAGASVWAGAELTRPPYDGHVGIAYGEANAPLHQTDIDFHIWYPAEPGGRAVTVGGNGVFHGTLAGLGAPHGAVRP